MDAVKINTRLRSTFASWLADNGKRCTPERMRVLDVALSLPVRFEAESLVAACESDSELRVSRATVFNCLPLLERAGLLRRTSHDRHVTYETVRQTLQLKARQHLICTDCGKVQRLQAPLLAAFIAKQTYRDFTPRPESSMAYIYGLCNKCRRKMRTQIDKNHKTQ